MCLVTGGSRVSETGQPAAAAQTTQSAFNEIGAFPPCTLRARSSASDTATVTVCLVRRLKLTHRILRLNQQSMVRSYSDVLSRIGGQPASRLPTRCVTCPVRPVRSIAAGANRRGHSRGARRTSSAPQHGQCVHARFKSLLHYCLQLCKAPRQSLSPPTFRYERR
jgi:hypothetical protein